MLRRASLALGIILWSAAVSLAHADALKEGRELYKAGRYAEAAVKLEQATREDPNNPRAWWQLNFAYNKLGRYSDALRAAEKAGQLDPSYAFASEPGKYAETVARLRKKAGSSGGLDRPLIEEGSRRTSRSSEKPLDTSMVRQLSSRGVYAEPGIRLDTGRLGAVVRELRPVRVMFLVFNSRAGSSTLAREADRVRRYFGIKEGYVIACSRAGVAASSAVLSPDTLREQTRQVAPRMEMGDYTGALETLARNLVAVRAAQTTRTRTTGAVVIGGIGVLVVGWVFSRRIRHSRAMAARRAAIEQSKSEIIAQMNYLEDSLSAAPAATAGLVRQARLEAGTKLDEASRIIVRARSEYDLTRAQRLLDEASAAIVQGRDALEGKPASARSGPASAQGVPPVYREAAATSAGTDWSAVPENERGVCFFCSRPSLLSELTPVTVNIEGQQQRVLACADDLHAIQTGETPRIRAFDRGGRLVPWYADDEYDPYRDYYRRGYDDRSLLTDLVYFQMIDRMYWDWHRPSWHWGGGYGPDWDGYAFSPDHHHWRDYQIERAAEHAYDRDSDAGGTDFLGAGLGGDAADAGGTDFLGADNS
jgi:tetratricopeptide (TPR) repeat protein